MHGFNNLNVRAVMVNGSVTVRRVGTVRMHIERCQYAHIATQAAGTEGHGNQGKAQDLASEEAHKRRKA